MRFHSKVVLILPAAVACLFVGTATSRAAAPTIDVVLGAGNVFQVTYNGGTLGSATAPGGVVPPGAYQVIVDNTLGDVGFSFHLSGPGVNLQTDVDGGEQVTETWDETFQANATYQFEDDTNPAATVRYFSTAATGGVTSIGAAAGAGSGGSGKSGSSNGSTGPLPVSTTTKVAPLPERGTLIGAVSTTGALTLELKGKQVATLKPGRYTIRVSDKTRKNGFIIQESGKASTTITSAPFVGVKSVSVSMGTGQWFFYPTFIGAKRFFAVIA